MSSLHRSWREDAAANPNSLTSALETRRRAGLPILDLTQSNPTQCGLRGPEGWIRVLNQPAATTYAPDAQGSIKAREAIASYYSGRDISISSDDIFLTSGTSEGYAYIFKLICKSGDALLTPAPSYPLLGALAELEGIELESYGRIASAECGPRTKGLCVVQPNNPTGRLLGPEEAEFLRLMAEQRNLALIVDEVFSDYTFGPPPPRLLEGPLVFTLNGLSKLLGLPQLKLAWIHVGGSDARRKAEAKKHLEWICDAFLSVNGPAQMACPSLLERRAEFQAPIRKRLETNLARLRTLAETTDKLQPLWPQGGWSIPIRCLGVEDDENLAVDLLASDGVHVHPGYFFDFPENHVIVLSLLPEPDLFREGMESLLRRLHSRA